MSTTESIANLPTSEIARNLARLQRAKFALKQAYTQPEAGEIAWKLAQPKGASDPYLGTYWAQPEQRRVSYELLLIDSLKDALHLGIVKKAAATPYEHIDIHHAPEPAQHIEERDLGRVIYDQARVEALGRLGLLTVRGSEVSVPLGALAALHYQRADIKSHTDCTLYERPDSIGAHADRLLSQVPKRTVEITVLAANETGTGMEPKQITTSVFSAVEPGTEWWREVAYDLDRIDEAAKILPPGGA